MSSKARMRSQCISKPEDGPCPVLYAHVNGCPVLAYIDSGSTESFVTRHQIDFWNSHGSDIKIEENAVDFIGTMFNATNACGRARATIPISFGEQQRPWPCTIVDGECSSIILGIDFLRNFADRLNFETGCIVWLATPLSERYREYVAARAEPDSSPSDVGPDNNGYDFSSSWEYMDTEDTEAEAPAKKFRGSMGETVAIGSLVGVSDSAAAGFTDSAVIGFTDSAATGFTDSAATSVTDVLRSLSTNRGKRKPWCKNCPHERRALFEDVYDLEVFKELERLREVQAECDESERALLRAVAKCKAVLSNHAGAAIPQASSRGGNGRVGEERDMGEPPYRPTKNRVNRGLEEFHRLLLAVERSTREMSLESERLPNEGPVVD